ncbi:phosphatase PAP2 family protein [Paracoccaceae bacterium Fryx2]|nr:phosphatase PAP2 family protein [Paracoccaceae bacterium Fryx2]
MPAPDLRRWSLWLLAVAFGCLVLFGTWPGIDLWVSGLFHDPEAGFWLTHSRPLSRLRHLIWDASLLTVALSALAFGLCLWRGRMVFGLPARIWGFVAALYILGPGVLVNLVLKAHWGRVRPADVTEFGGALPFTAVQQWTGQCVRNCSFVSGEGSAVVALAISALVVLAYRSGRLWPGRKVAAGLAALVVIGAGMRVATGRHFLSDTAFAAIFVSAVALGLYALLLHPERLHHRAVLTGRKPQQGRSR